MIDPKIPFIDLHRHLDGNIRLETILDLGQQHGLPLPADSVESIRPYVQVTEPQPGVMAFLAKFEWMRRVLVDPQACWRVAYENVEDAAREKLDYIELRFSPWFMAEANNLQVAAVVEAVCDGIAAGRRDFKQPVNLIGILSRTYGPQIAWQELSTLLSQRDQIVGLDMAGDEAGFPGELFNEHFRKVREYGLNITVHAGESVGAESIWQAVHELGAQRLGHAIRAIDDSALMDYLVEMKIGIETNLTSNVQTSCVQDYSSHPVRQFLERGILTNLNSDDPGISGIDLAYEYEVAAPAAGLSPDLIRLAQSHALEMAFLTPAEKANLLSKTSGR